MRFELIENFSTDFGLKIWVYQNVIYACLKVLGISRRLLGLEFRVGWALAIGVYSYRR